ncbi:hypothetical protein GTW51_02765 [Aurantimonas aggregata]|uniref:ATP-binding protein n=1 Tax=Aurantimonas aggregata TaxID=2047720 RepID=A0A6L9MCS1_9HYPH|nr:hypothetical protein [Aurantimonas aggregata]NDV85615.1 hypothetical protein [Aurantimonas aggregata]
MATHAGVNKHFRYDPFTLSERQVISRFAEHFYVTRNLDPVKVGNSIYRAFLMRPAETFSVVLNVEREFIVLFADYETFEARTLSAYDRVAEEFHDARIDNSIRFLVSADRNIETSIRHYLSQDPEYPIIVPFHYDDFRHSRNDFIIQRIRSNYVVRDIFGYQSPLRHEYFYFGRDNLINHVIDLHKSGQNSSLFGLRKSGKTSTIYAITRRAKVFGHKSITIDCQDPSVHARGYAELLSHIINEIRVSLGLKSKKVELTGEAFEISDQFKASMDSLLSEARSDILLIFDEIECISPNTASSPHWNEGYDTLYFWQILRSYFQNTRKYKLTFCFVGTNPTLFESPRIDGADNPVYLFAPKTFITPLSESDVFDMIKKLGFFMGMDFSSSILSKICGEYGGHPFFTRQLCSKIHHELGAGRPQQVGRKELESAVSKNRHPMKSYISDILLSLQRFYPLEFDMLSYLSQGKVENFEGLSTEYPELLEHLIGYGFIKKEGSSYELSFSSISDAFKGDNNPNVFNEQDASIEISKGRNRIERSIRQYLFYETNRMSREEWQELCQLSFPRTWEKNKTLTPRAVFSQGGSPLYFIDLLKTLQYLGNFATDAFGEGDIAGAMHVVNRHRVDAHATAIAEVDFTEWQAEMNVLDSVFEAPV